MRALPPRAFAACAVVLLTAACASPEREREESRQAVVSWTASANWAAAAWAANQAPIAYAQDAVDLAAEALRKERERLARRTAEPGNERASLADAVQRLDGLYEAAKELADALRHADRPTVRRILDELPRLQQEFSDRARRANAGR